MEKINPWKPSEDIPEITVDSLTNKRNYTSRSMLIVGQSESGKTTIVTSIISDLAARYSKILWFYGGKDPVERFRKNPKLKYDLPLPPRCYIHLTATCKNGTLAIQDAIDSQGTDPNNNNRTCIILDDVTYTGELTNKKTPVGLALGYVSQVGRHDGITLVVIAHSLTGLHPALRNNSKIIIMMKPDSEETIDYAYKMVGVGMTKSQFRYLVDKNTNDYGAIVFDKIRRMADSKLSNWVFTFNARDKPRLKIWGCKELWEGAEGFIGKGTEFRFPATFSLS